VFREGGAGERQGLIRVWKGLKDTRSQYFRNGNEKNKNKKKATGKKTKKQQRPVLSSPI